MARRSDTGLINPYRPCPADFRERYLELGFSKEIEEHYRTNWRCIRRWIGEAGGEELRQARAARSGAQLRPDLRTPAESLKPVATLRARRGGIS